MTFSLGSDEDDEFNLWSLVAFLSGQRPDTQRAFAIMTWEIGGQNRRKVWAAFDTWASLMNGRLKSRAGEAMISEMVKFVFAQISDSHRFEVE